MAPKPSPAVDPGRTDLRFVFPSLPGQDEAIAGVIESLLREKPGRASLEAAFWADEQDGIRELIAEGLRQEPWRPAATDILLAPSGKAALAGALMAASRHGKAIGVEALTYQGTKELIRTLRLPFAALPLDAEGIQPAAIAAANSRTPLGAICLQPTLHNPLGVTMTEKRRAEIVEVAEALDLSLIEDSVFGFLDPSLPTLAAMAPGRTVLVDSLSKRTAIGCNTGIIVAGAGALRDAISSVLHAGGWWPTKWQAALAARLFAAGLVSTLSEAKRQDARSRQQMAREHVGEWTTSGPSGYHLWIDLPPGWTSNSFARAVERAGILVSEQEQFSMTPSPERQGVRVSLATPELEGLRHALARMAGILGGEGTGASQAPQGASLGSTQPAVRSGITRKLSS